MDDPGVVGLVDAFEHSVSAGIAVATREPRLINERTSLGETALHLLVLGESADAVAAFLDLGADVNALSDFGDTALMNAALLGRADLVQLLLRFGAVIRVEGQREPTLHKAVRSGDLETVGAILDAGAEVDETAGFAETALHIAAEECLPLILGMLVQRGADISLRHTYDGTALDIAHTQGSQACIDLLSPKH